MRTESIYTFAKWRVKQDQLETVLKMLADLATHSTAEPGNLVYEAHQSKSDESTLLLFEGYKNESALLEHRASHHYRTLVVDGIVPLLEERDITVTTRL